MQRLAIEEWAHVSSGDSGPPVECQPELMDLSKSMYCDHDGRQQGRLSPRIGNQTTEEEPRRL